jgi:hypothetical protein
MPRPTQEEIDEFNARMNEPETPDVEDFEIEIFTPEGHGARLPYSKGRAYLQQHFGIDLDETPPATVESGKTGKRNTGKTQSTVDSNTLEGDGQTVNPPTPIRATQRYFGRQSAS